VRRPLVFLHRWLGITLCLMFMLWFATGAVLLFVPFPSLNGDDANRHALPLRMEQVVVTPAEAAAGVEHAAVSMRLIQRIDGPAYVIADDAGHASSVAAGSMPLPSLLDAAKAGQTASAFTGAVPIGIAGPMADDQWTVHQHFDPWRPLYRVAMDDSARTDIYVSALTGEVVQRTTRWQRGWNWVGAVVHWIYPTVLRRHWNLWNQSVWALSLLGVGVALAGAWLGARQTLRMKRMKRPGVTPFGGWMRWHHLLGLAGCLVLIPWIVSGWLSMDHGRIFSTQVPQAEAADIYRGVPLSRSLSPWTIPAIRSVQSASSIRFTVVGGRPYGVIQRADAAGVWDVSRGVELEELPDENIAAAIRQAWPTQAMVSIDTPPPMDLYVAAEGFPADVRRVVLAGTGDHWLYIDRGGALLGDLDRSRRAYAWFYYAVHTLHFPGLNSHPVFRLILALACLLLGFSLSASGAIVGILRLRRVLGSAAPRKTPSGMAP
jgi:hypothetical protein